MTRKKSKRFLHSIYKKKYLHKSSFLDLDYNSQASKDILKEIIIIKANKLSIIRADKYNILS